MSGGDGDATRRDRRPGRRVLGTGDLVVHQDVLMSMVIVVFKPLPAWVARAPAAPGVA